MQKVAVSVPVHSELGRDAVAAAGLALEDAGASLELLVLDARNGSTGANAQRAAADRSVVAYVGELHSAASAITIPLLEHAGIAQVSFSNTYRDLVGSSFFNVMVTDERQAAGLVRWMLELGVRRPFLAHADDYGFDMRWLVHRALAAAGVRVLGAAGAGGDISPMRDADGVFVGAVAGEDSVALLERVAQAAPDALLFAFEGLAHPELAAALPAAIAERLHITTCAVQPPGLPPAGQAVRTRLRERLGHEPDSHAIYAYEALALLLEAADGSDRSSLIERLKRAERPNSALGPYRLDETGATTLAATGRMRIEGGRLVPSAYAPRGA